MSSRAGEWFEDEELWVESFGPMFPKESFEVARREADQIAEIAGRREGAVLDLACGPGRHAVPLALRGFAVTGVDRTGFLLERAREYADAEGAEVELVREDMRDFVRPEAFDLAVCMFTSFGLFEDDEENRTVLENVFVSLRPGAPFVLDVMGKEIIARTYQPAACTDFGDGELLVQRRAAVEDWSRMELEWIFLRDQRVVRSFRLRHFIYSARELGWMLAEQGFVETRAFGDLAGAPYGPEAKRLVLVARKPA